MKKSFLAATGFLAALFVSPPAFAFCGCFIPPAPKEVVAGQQKLTNDGSKVVIAHQGDRTVVTLSNNYKGDLEKFAMVIPVPAVVEKGQIHVADSDLVDRLESFSSPRLTEIQELDPCQGGWVGGIAMKDAESSRSGDDVGGGGTATGKSYGVTIEAEYAVGEYDIVILSATQSKGLERWLKDNDYAIPKGASRIFGSYIRQDMKFFVAKVNLDEHARSGFRYLRPLQLAYESPKFMLPIRMGTLNADGPQNLTLYTLTTGGRVEPTNYRTVKMPSGAQVPAFVKRDFHAFYEAVFDREVIKENMRVVFLEYAGRSSWSPFNTAAGPEAPLSAAELRKLGAFWSGDAFVTRMRVRYDEAHFPSDLVLQETGDQGAFNIAYTARIPWEGDAASCPAASQYFRDLHARQETDAQMLARLTGWDINDIRRKQASFRPSDPSNGGKWWEQLWGN